MMVAGRPAKVLLIDSNVYFAKRLGEALQQVGFEVLTHHQVPPNDGGLALGQAAVSVLTALDEGQERAKKGSVIGG